MAGKNGKKKQDAACRKGADTEFRKKNDGVFTGGGNAAYQPRDADDAKTGRSAGRKKQTADTMHTQHQTSGHEPDIIGLN